MDSSENEFGIFANTFFGKPHPTACNVGLRPVILKIEAQK